MKKKEKRLILVLIAILVIVLIIGLFIKKNKNKENEIQNQNTATDEKFVQVLEDGTKLNKSSKFNETKNIDGIEISNIQFTYKDGQTV